MINSGFLLIDKPEGWTSFDVVAKLRTITNIRKIGHAGTLDPFATGLLIIAIERSATKQIDSFMSLDKEYIAEFVIGATTESLDTETDIVIDENIPKISQIEIENAIKELTGQIEQIPPMYSAIKINGERLYKLAREGKKIERKPRNIEIYNFELIDKIQKQDNQFILNVKIKCSTGTYIRALARDLGKLLGTTGYVRSLQRTKIGNFNVSNAIDIKELNHENWQDSIKDLSSQTID